MQATGRVRSTVQGYVNKAIKRVQPRRVDRAGPSLLYELVEMSIGSLCESIARYGFVDPPKWPIATRTARRRLWGHDSAIRRGLKGAGVEVE